MINNTLISLLDINNKSVRDVAKYYLSYRDGFEAIRAELSTHGAVSSNEVNGYVYVADL